MFRVYGWCLTCAPLCFSGAQLCSYPSTKVPLPWHNSALPKALCLLSEQEYLLGILFSCFLIIENACSSISIKIDVVDFWKNLYSVENIKSECDFTLHPFIFSPEVPINIRDLRMNGKVQPFITLHHPSSFLPFLAHF